MREKIQKNDVELKPSSQKKDKLYLEITIFSK